MFIRDFADIKYGESFDTEWNLFSVIYIAQNECVQKYCSADFQFVARWNAVNFGCLNSCFFFSAMAHNTSTRKEIKYNFFYYYFIIF